jgi:hypothetical protein
LNLLTCFSRLKSPIVSAVCRSATSKISIHPYGPML